MKKTFKNGCVLSLFITIQLYGINSAISCDLRNCGRLGDCIVAYCKAKYLSIKYHVPFLFKSFPYSEQFAMYVREQYYSSDMCFTKQVLVRHSAEIDPNSTDTLYLVDIYTSMDKPYIHDKQFVEQALPMKMNFWIDEIYEQMVQDQSFNILIKEMLRPLHYLIVKSDSECCNIITVAVHIRKGSGGDCPLFSKQLYELTENDFKDGSGVQYSRVFHDIMNPLRFVPEQYYIDQINKLVSYFPDKKFVIYLFTDSPNPVHILNNFQKNCSSINCTVILKTEQWQHDVLKDICEMAMCDCLIRSSSHFAGISQLIGNHKLIISPQDYCWVHGCLIITKSNIIINDPMFSNLKYYLGSRLFGLASS